ncbi:MAG: hypothetical protein HY975_02240 [Candidatus Kerfeldbacteria bacterium]|nr:hypothetical protein [Candidatus Kerfeldbacteria bacterium]
MGSFALAVPKGVTIQNAAPAFTAGPSDGGSDSTAPTNVGSNVTFTATATDSNNEQYYLAVCKSNSVTAGNNAAPTCPGGSWAISAATTSGVAITPITYTTLVGDASSNAWYAFACDKVVGGGSCSSMSQGASTTGSPFAVNHQPVIGTVKLGSACDSTTSVDPGNSRSAITTTDFSGANDEAYAMTMQSDGKSVVAGKSGNNFALARYNADGTLDTTFDTDGKVATPIGTAYAVAVQSDGKIVAVGVSSGSTFTVARYNANGSLDTSFDTDGIATTLIGSYGFARAVAIQSDGKIVVAGQTFNGSDYDFAVARYNTNGSLDTSFDTDGIQTTAFDTGEDSAYGLALQTDGKIVVAGLVSISSIAEFGIARYNTNGSLDTGFDTDGKVATLIGTQGSWAYSVAIQPSDQKIVVGGSSRISGSHWIFATARYNTNGSLDTGFDTDGMNTVEFETSWGEDLYSIALQSDGKIVGVGRNYNNTSNYLDLAVARFNANGSIDTSFDTDGKTTISLGNYDTEGHGAAVDPSGNILASGWSDTATTRDFGLVRYTTAGALDNLSGYVCAQAGITDSDPSDTVDMFVCSTNSFNGTTCSSTTLCAITDVTTGGSAQCIAYGQVPIPTASGSYSVYVFLKDSFGFASSGSTQSYTVTNVAPTISASTQYTVSNITLVAGSSVAPSYSVIVTDNNGGSTISATTGVLYDDDAINLAGGTCSANEKNCYPGVSCTPGTATGADRTFTCGFTVWFNANFSDSALQDWRLHANPTDGTNSPTALTDSNAIQVGALAAISAIGVSEASIAYGSLSVGTASSSGVLTTLQNAGNQILDVLISGTDMTFGSKTIPKEQQKFHETSSTFDWTSGGGYVLIASPPSAGTETNGCLNRDLAVRAVHNVATEDESIWWKLMVPLSQASGTYSGSNTIAGATSATCTGTLY